MIYIQKLNLFTLLFYIFFIIKKKISVIYVYEKNEISPIFLKLYKKIFRLKFVFYSEDYQYYKNEIYYGIHKEIQKKILLINK